MQRVYSQSGEPQQGNGMPNGFDPSQMEEMFKNMTPEQRAQMENMASNMSKNRTQAPKVEEID